MPRSSHDASGGRPARTIVIPILLAVALAGCRADTLSAPDAADCTGQPGCSGNPAAALDPTVSAPLGDGLTRLAPGIGAAASQSALTGAVTTLDHALQGGRPADAPAALAHVYADLESLKVPLPDGIGAGWALHAATIRLEARWMSFATSTKSTGMVPVILSIAIPLGR